MAGYGASYSTVDRRKRHHDLGAGGQSSRGAPDISTQPEICPLDFRGGFRDNYPEMMSYHLARTNLVPNSWVRRVYSTVAGA